MLDTAMSKFGRLDILHNNAGIGVGAPGYPDAPPERWHLVVEIDLQAVILGTGLAAPLMQKNGGGVIINTASMAGLYPHRQDAVYGAAKGGVVNFTHSLASGNQSERFASTAFVRESSILRWYARDWRRRRSSA